MNVKCIFTPLPTPTDKAFSEKLYNLYKDSLTTVQPKSRSGTSGEYELDFGGEIGKQIISKPEDRKIKMQFIDFDHFNLKYFGNIQGDGLHEDGTVGIPQNLPTYKSKPETSVSSVESDSQTPSNVGEAYLLRLRAKKYTDAAQWALWDDKTEHST